LHENEINFASELLSFLSYEDLGIAQGIILIPLIMINEWIRIRNEVKWGYVGIKQVEIINLNKRNSYLRIGFFALLLALQSLIFIPEVTFVFLFLGFLSILFFLK
jgi:hypothetical protein